MKGTIVITGAAGAIGIATAHTLAKQEYDLLLADLVLNNDLIEDMKQYENRITWFNLDVSDKSSIDTFIEQISDTPNIIGLVTLAGITRDRTIKKMTEDEWNSVIDINLKGTFLMVQSIAPLMENGGSIVTIGSVVSNFGNYGQANYVASKAGVEGISKVAAREFATSSIRVNCILPGFIKSPMTDRIPHHLRENTIKQIPLGRIGYPEDIAEVVEFLISDKSSYITGSSLNVNGGAWMG